MSFSLSWPPASALFSWFKFAQEQAEPRRPGLLDLSIGLLVNFLDALGIGSFGTTTSVFKLSGLVRDEQIPGTLNIGLTLPAILEAFLYIGIINVDKIMLVSMIVAAVTGGWLGGGVVAHWPTKKVQVGMGIALIVHVNVCQRSRVLRPAATPKSSDHLSL